MDKYFIRYKNLIFVLCIPIAFITPISRNSSSKVKLIVNLRTTNAIRIINILKIRSTAAVSVSIIYVIFIVFFVAVNNALSKTSDTSASSADTSSLLINPTPPQYEAAALSLYSILKSFTFNRYLFIDIISEPINASLTNPAIFKSRLASPIVIFNLSPIFKSNFLAACL